LRSPVLDRAERCTSAGGRFDPTRPRRPGDVVRLTTDSALVDVAFPACTVLDRAGTVAVLTGDGAATCDTPQYDRLMDADIVLCRVPEPHVLHAATASRGYDAESGMYALSERISDRSYPQARVDEFLHRLNER
jgi:hypothetical protein